MMRRRPALSSGDVGDGVLAEPELASDQAVAAALCDESEDLRREAVGLRPLLRLPAELLAPRLHGRHAGTVTLADELALEFGDAGDDGGRHPSVRRREVEGQVTHGDHRNAPRLEFLQRVQEVERAALPTGQLGHSILQTDQVLGSCQILN